MPMPMFNHSMFCSEINWPPRSHFLFTSVCVIDAFEWRDGEIACEKLFMWTLNLKKRPKALLQQMVLLWKLQSEMET